MYKYFICFKKIGSSIQKQFQQFQPQNMCVCVCVCVQPPEKYEDIPCYSVSVMYLGQWGRMDGTMVVSKQWYWFLGHTVFNKNSTICFDKDLAIVLTNEWRCNFKEQLHCILHSRQQSNLCHFKL